MAEQLLPRGSAPPLHRHTHEDEIFYILDGTAEFRCEGDVFTAGPGDFVLLPAGLPHTFLVGPDAPLHACSSPRPAGSNASPRH